jgi:hypothetical protein
MIELCSFPTFFALNFDKKRWPWHWYTIIYIFSVVDNFEFIAGLGVGIPLFIFFPLLCSFSTFFALNFDKKLAVE